MKNLLLLTAFLIATTFSFAQVPITNNQYISNEGTLYHIKGVVTGDIAVRIPNIDTLNHPATSFGGSLVRLPSDGFIYMSDGIRWVRIGTNSTSGITDTIYTRIPIAVDSITIPGKRILYLLHLDGVVTPGYVIWTGIGLNFWVTPANYYINYRQFNSPFTTVTLDPAPVANSRIDLFIVDTNATATKITGTVAASPLVPQTNPSAQLPLTSITVNAGDTIPAGIGLQTIYDENLGTPTEFQTGSGGTISVDYDNTDNPYWGTKAAFVSTYTDGSALTFTDNVDDTVQNGELLRFFVYFNGIFTNQFQFRLYNGTTPLGTAISINTGFGMNPNDTGRYQIVAIPLSSFNVATGTIFTKLVITMAGEDISGAKGYYLDYMQLQTGLNNINPDFTLTTDSTSGPSTWDPIRRILNIPVYGGGGNDSAYINAIALDDTTLRFTRINGDVTDILIQGGGTVLSGTGYVKMSGATPSYVPQIPLTTDVTGVLPILNGGTNISTYTTGDVLYSSASNVLSKLAIGSTSQVLTVVAGIPAWATATLDSAIWKNNATYVTGSHTLTLAGNSQTFTGGKVVFDSTTTGTDYTRIGLLLNESFSGGSIPSGWTKGANITTSYTGGKVTVTGAAAIGAPSAGNITAAFLSGLQYDTRRMPYENLDFQMSIVPTTKSANALVGVYKGVLGLTIYSQEAIAWDLSNGTNSGRVTITFGSAGAGGNSVPTFVTNVDSTSKANFSVNDSLILYYKKRGWGVVAGIINKTTGQVTSTYFNQRWDGSGGRWNLVFMNGTYVMTNAKVNVLDRKGGVWFIGDSQTGGYGNTLQSRRYSDVLFQQNPKYFSVLGLPSMTAKYFVDGGLVTELLTDAVPTKVVEALSYNDETEATGAFTAPNTKINVDSIIYPLQRAGITVGVSGIVPRAGITTDIWNDSLQSLALSRGADFYDIRTPLKTAIGFNGTYAYDVHINDSGAIVVANVIRAKSGDSLFLEQSADTTYIQKLYGLQNSRVVTTAGIVGINNDGSLARLPNLLPTSTGWIQNKLRTATMIDLPQLAEIHVSSAIKSDSSVSVIHPQGGRFGFNDGIVTATTGANLNMTNSGSGSLIQVFDNITGSGNVKISTSSATRGKTAVQTISGSDNSLFNYSGTSTMSGSGNNIFGASANLMTSGSNNIGIGTEALRGVTTGSSNLHLITVNGATQGQTASLSNSIILGEYTSYDPYVANDIAFSTGYTASVNNFWFGSKGGTGLTGTTMNFPAPASGTTNATGFPAYIRVGRGVSAGKPGSLSFQTWTPLGTGNTYQSTAITKMLFDYMGIGMGTATVTAIAADALLDLQSTTQGFLPPRMTSTQRDAVSNGVQTLSVLTAGSGYTNGNVVGSFSGGGGSGAAGYAVIATGVVSNVVLTSRGSGYTSAPTFSVTSGAGTGATFTVTIGGTTGNIIYNTTTSRIESWNGTFWQPTGAISGSFSGVGVATTVFTVTIGNTMANATYNVQVTPTSALSAALFYVTNKTTTTFDVTYLAGLTGTVTYDWVVTP